MWHKRRADISSRVNQSNQLISPTWLINCNYTLEPRVSLISTVGSWILANDHFMIWTNTSSSIETSQVHRFQNQRDFQRFPITDKIMKGGHVDLLFVCDAAIAIGRSASRADSREDLIRNFHWIADTNRIESYQKADSRIESDLEA